MATATKNRKATKVSKVKRAAKKAVSKRAGVAAAPTPNPAVEASNPLRVAADETFSTEQETRTVPKGKLHLIVNGQDKGLADVEGRNLGKFVMDAAKQYGIRNFSVYADGNKIRQDAVGSPLDSVTKLEIVAKDSRAADELEQRAVLALEGINKSLLIIVASIQREMAEEADEPTPAATAAVSGS